MTNTRLAQLIVADVLEDLGDRSGIGNAIDECDDDIRMEIEHDLVLGVVDVLDKYKVDCTEIES